MPAKRTEPRIHAYQRPAGMYVPSGHDASRLVAVYAAERERLEAEANKNKRRRKPKTEATDTSNDNPAQLRLVG